MFEPAKLQMNWARARGRINLRRESAGRSGATAWLSGSAFSVN
jgi:hypothetical protein